MSLLFPFQKLPPGCIKDGWFAFPCFLHILLLIIIIIVIAECSSSFRRMRIFFFAVLFFFSSSGLSQSIEHYLAPQFTLTVIQISRFLLFFLGIFFCVCPVRLLEADDESRRGDPEPIPLLLLRAEAIQEEPGSPVRDALFVRWWDGDVRGCLPQLPGNVHALRLGPTKPGRNSDLFRA